MINTKTILRQGNYFEHNNLVNEVKDLLTYCKNFNSLSNNTKALNWLYLYIENRILNVVGISIPVKKNIAKQVYNYILQNILKTVLNYEYLNAQSCELIPENESKKYYYNTITNDIEWVSYFLETYTVIPFLISSFIEKQLLYLQEVLHNLELDKEVLMKLFGVTNLKTIDLFLGDLHNDNKTTLKLTFKNSVIIYYKPHNLDNEIWMHKEVSKYIKGYTIPKIYSKPSYCYYEHIENKPLNNISQLPIYYENLGILMAFCMVYDSTDLLAENIIANGIYPTIIDWECSFSKYDYSDFTFERKFQIMWAGLRNGIIPESLEFKSEMDNVFLNRVSAIQDIIDYPVRNYSKNYLKSIISKRKSLLKDSKIKDTHLPLYNGVHYSVHNYIDNYYDGILMGFKYLEEKFSLPNTNLSHRVLLNNTSWYNKIHIEALKPDCLKSGKLYKNFLKQCVEKYSTKALKEHEFNDLLQFDIPYFREEINSKNLISNSNVTLVENYSQIKYLDYIKNKHELLKNNTEKLAKYHVSTLKESLSFLSPIQNELKHFFGKKINDNLLEKEKSESVINLLMTILHDRGCVFQDKIIYNRIEWSNISKEIILKTSHTDLYTGYVGIAFVYFTYCLHKNDKTSKFYERLLIMHNQAIDFAFTFINKKEKVHQYGFIQEPTSIIYLHLLLVKYFNISLNITLINDYQNWLFDNYESDKTKDYLVGYGGIICFLIEFKEYFNKEILNKIINLYLKDIAKGVVNKRNTGGIRFSFTKEFKQLISMSHGSAGFLYILNKICSYNKLYHKQLGVVIQKILIDIHKTLKNELELNTNERFLDLPSFNHGSTGILEAVNTTNTSSLPLDIQLIYAELKTILLNDLLNNWYKRNYSLANGISGNLLTLKRFEQLNISNLTITQIFQNMGNVNNGLTNDLYLGLPGVIVTLITLNSTFKMPNVLTMES